MNWKTVSRIFFAVTFVTIGAIGFASGDFAPIWNSVPEALPGRQPLAYLANFVAVTTGIGLIAKRWAAPAALALFGFLVAWTLAFKFRFIILAPLEEVSYQTNGENLVLVAAAWALFAEFANRPKFLADARGVRTAHRLYGLALVAFGLSHFFYLQMTAPLVPTWLPGPIFWAHLTGGLYLASGIALVTGVGKRLGAAIAAAQISLITLLVWGPMVLGGRMSAVHWQETIVSWALTASAWVMATGLLPTTEAWLSPPRRSRSAWSDIRR